MSEIVVNGDPCNTDGVDSKKRKAPAPKVKAEPKARAKAGVNKPRSKSKAKAETKTVKRGPRATPVSERPVTARELDALEAIKANPGAMVSKIGKEINASPANMTHLIRNLLAKGLIEAKVGASIRSKAFFPVETAFAA